MNTSTVPPFTSSPQHIQQTRQGGERSTRRARLLGLPVDRLSMRETLTCLAEWIQAARATRSAHQPLQLQSETFGAKQVVTLNPEMAMAARRDAALRRAILSADLVLPDGMGIVWALRSRGDGVPERVTGVDLLEAFAVLAAAHGFRIFLLGAAPGVAKAAARRLVKLHPSLLIVGTHAGSPDDIEAPRILSRIRASDADVVFVAFGIPAQDRWIAAHRARLGAAVAIGVGGAFDFIAGRTPRAPRWMRQIGLEWLYRLARQPWRWQRMLALPRFAVAVLRDTRNPCDDERGIQR